MSNSLWPPQTVAHQAPLSMEFSRWEYWSGLQFPSPGHLSNSRIEARSLALQAESLPSKTLGKLSSPSPLIMDWLHSLSLLKPPLLASEFSSSACHLSAFTELKRARVMLWIRLWLEGMLRLVCSSVQTTTTFSIAAVRLLCFFYHSCVHWSSIFNFLQELFPSTHNWANALVQEAKFFTYFLHSVCSFLTFDLKWEKCDSSFHLNT